MIVLQAEYIKLSPLEKLALAETYTPHLPCFYSIILQYYICYYKPRQSLITYIPSHKLQSTGNGKLRDIWFMLPNPTGVHVFYIHNFTGYKSSKPESYMSSVINGFIPTLIQLGISPTGIN